MYSLISASKRHASRIPGAASFREGLAPLREGAQRVREEAQVHDDVGFAEDLVTLETTVLMHRHRKVVTFASFNFTCSIRLIPLTPLRGESQECSHSDISDENDALDRVRNTFISLNMFDHNHSQVPLNYSICHTGTVVN